MEANHKFLSFVPLDELQTPSNGSQVMVDYWWTIHPDKGTIFYKKFSPQANRHESIQKKLSNETYPWAEAVFIHVAYIPRRHIPTDF